MAELKQLLSYTVGDDESQNVSLKTVIGEQFDTEDALEKLKRTPVDSGIPFKALQIVPPGPTPGPDTGADKKDDPPGPVQISQDRSFHSFNYGSDVRGLLTNVITNVLNPDSPSYDSTVSLVALPRSAGSFWSTLARDITVLASDGGYALTNPRGLCGMNGRLYTANFDDKRIYNIGKNELNGLPDNSTYELKAPAFDIYAAAAAADDPIPENAKGQALFPLRDGGIQYLPALLITPQPGFTGYGDSVIARMSVDRDTGELSYKDKASAGPNAQGLALGTDNAGVKRLIGYGMGGPQNSGGTNGIKSSIWSLPAFGFPWPNVAKIHLTGDPAGGSGAIPVVYDIRVVDIAYRGRPDDKIVIFAGIYTNGYANFSYAVYLTTAAQLFALNGATISEAAASGAITYVFGESNAPGKNLWDICIALGNTPDEDVLWLRGGSELTARLVRDLGKPDARVIKYGKGMGPCRIGGTTINTVDVTSETQRQAETGLGKKRTLGGTPPEVRGRQANPGK